MAKKRAPKRNEHIPNDERKRMVQAMALGAIKQDVIAAVLGISDVTLRKHYRHELENGSADILGQVTDKLITKALSKDHDALKAQMFILERRSDAWKFKSETKTEGDIDIRQLSDAQLAKLAGISISDVPMTADEWKAKYCTPPAVEGPGGNA